MSFLKHLRSRAHQAWARVNDPFWFLDPFSTCDVAGHRWVWSYHPDGSANRCFCVRPGCDRTYWGGNS